MAISKKNRASLGFDDLLFRLIGVPVVAFFMPILFFDEPFPSSLQAYLPHWGASIIFTICYWEGSRWMVCKIRQQNFRKEEEWKRILLEVALICAYSFFISVTLCGLENSIYQAINIRHEPLPLFNAMVGSLSVCFVVLGIYEVVYFYKKWEQALIEKERFKRDAIQSQLEGLKAQINPHFLFNSLNTLVYMIPENPDRAVQFVQQLSKVYRYVLEMRHKETVALHEELTCLDSFIFLLEQRFEENLQIDIDIPESALNRHVLPMSLQMLLENAIKHNIVSTAAPLRIDMLVQGGKLVVRNNLQRKNQVIESTKVGLENIRSRYRFFTQEEVEVIVSQQHFIVLLPLLNIASIPPVKPAVLEDLSI